MSDELLILLRKELKFLQQGGYGSPFRSSWRPTLIFRDSPVCLNFGPEIPVRPCADCRLFTVVPEEKRNEFVPCHHIPLGERGETIAGLYKTGTQSELDSAVHMWLQNTIKMLEEKEGGHANP